MSGMRFDHDEEVNALYIYFREILPGGVARTIELEEGINLDVDDQDRILGIEFVDVSKTQVRELA